MDNLKNSKVIDFYIQDLYIHIMINLHTRLHTYYDKYEIRKLFIFHVFIIFFNFLLFSDALLKYI